MEEIVRLTAVDYEEGIDFLNLVFSQAGRPHHFQKMLPRLDADSMRKHFALRRDGRIRAMLGVYPLPVVIDGEEFLFSTTGNVATHWLETGKGYMSRLLDRAMIELADIGADASRLGGFRQRYNRYGFETAGTAYHVSVGAHNAQGMTAEIAFERVEASDKKALSEIEGLRTKDPMYAVRGEDSYRVLTAWEAAPYVAKDKAGRTVGYLAVMPGGDIAEMQAENAGLAKDMTVAWLKAHPEKTVDITLAPWEQDVLRALAPCMQSVGTAEASQFKIISWQRIVNALCRVQSRLRPLCDGSCVVEITGEARLRIAVENGKARCEETALPADVTMDHLTATRFLFGPAAPDMTAAVPNAMMMSLLPLPLGWSGQDRL